MNTNIINYFNFKYQLDTFQINGCQAIAKNENLLVTAHTGSGKTALALYAISKTLSENKKVIYTSPIKTLSNQKYAEFSEHFKSIGILTGDIKINPMADLLIMTAEILRNSLLKKCNIYSDFNINDVGCIILDEIHYINNQERGHVWEEILISLNPNIQLVMLSATINKPNEFVNWIIKLKNINCCLTTTSKRPVPLHHGIWWNNKITYFLLDNIWKEGIWQEKSNQIYKYYKTNTYNINNFLECINHLYKNNLTPANIFLLNKKLIEKYSEKISINMTTPEESSKIIHIWNKKLYKYKNIYDKTLEWNNLYKYLIKGIGIHHSGMTPILKEIVEILYSEGLIKILLTTETFAVGVNMPTKTVVFFNMYKYDNIHRVFKPEEYGQMAGRAGRRGLDNIGHVIILPSNDFINEADAKKIIISNPQTITSKLSLDIVFILKEISYMTDTNNDITTIINNIIIKYNNSLFNYQDELITNSLKIDINENNDISEEMISICFEITKIDEKLKSNGIIKLDNKSRKRLTTEKNILMQKISNWNINKINEHIIAKNKLNNIQSFKNINTQIDILISFLKKYNYIDDNYILSKHGKVISEINDCNPFLLSELINHESFSKLEFSEIVAISSIFINENKSNNDIYITDLNCTLDCKNILEDINKCIIKYKNDEIELNNIVPYPCWIDWTINYSMFNIIKLWTDGNDWNTIDDKKNIFQGSFIKIILRILNIINNIDNISKIFNFINITNKLINYQDKLMKDIVINDSLYII